MGRRFATQETRYGELQCRCGITAQLLPIHAPVAIMYYRHNRASVYHGANPQLPTPQESGGQIL